MLTMSDHGVTRSSRQAREHAGWACKPVNPVKIPREAGRSRRWSWADPRPLWESRNQIIADLWGDPTHHHRERWLETLGLGPQDPLLVDTFAGRRSVSFLVVGDTGEGATAQYRVAPTLLEQGKDTDFLFICRTSFIPRAELKSMGPSCSVPTGNTQARSMRFPETTTGSTTPTVSCIGSAMRPTGRASQGNGPAAECVSVYGGGPRRAV
jgi:hypothetical protein